MFLRWLLAVRIETSLVVIWLFPSLLFCAMLSHLVLSQSLFRLDARSTGRSTLALNLTLIAPLLMWVALLYQSTKWKLLQALIHYVGPEWQSYCELCGNSCSCRR